jgi:hypothetical protein
MAGDPQARARRSRASEIGAGATMDTKEQAPKIKPIDHGDLQALLQHAPRHTQGTTVRSRRARERPPVKSSDGRKRRTTNRTKQLNTNVTEEIFEMVSDLCERHDLTKAEFTERAFLLFAETLRGANGDGVARD